MVKLLVENTGDACAEHGGSRMLRGHRGSLGSRRAVDGDGHGAECTGSCLVKKRSWEDQTCGIDILVAARGDQIRKSENEGVAGEQNLADHLTKGQSWREIDDLI